MVARNETDRKEMTVTANRKNLAANGVAAPLSSALSARLSAFASKELKAVKNQTVDPVLSSLQPDDEFVYRSQFEGKLPKAHLDLIFGNETGLQTPDFREGLHAVRTRKSALRVKERKQLKVVQSSWSDDHYEEVPFDCDPFLSDAELSNRLSRAIYKMHPGRNGYSCSVVKVTRECPWRGKVELKHYCGIGD